MIATDCDVAIVGAGPSGLSAAIHLKQLGVASVTLIEREATAGGIPRHCGHSPFGMREFKRVLSGTNYTNKLTRLALSLGVDFLLNTSVVKINKEAVLDLSTRDGVQCLQAKKVLICTGNREMPRSTRLVSGSRPLGVLTTGALQSMVYNKHKLPFKRPVIIGSETVSFSAILTCRHAGIRPVAMIEENPQITAIKSAKWLPKSLGIRLLTDTVLQSIHGKECVESVFVKHGANRTETIHCDGVIFSGSFVPESSLARMGHLDIDSLSGSPVVDQYNRCSDPNYFACGNIIHPVDTAGWCWAEGKRVANFVHASISGALPQADKQVTICSSDPVIKYFTPQRISLPIQNAQSANPSTHQLQIRVTKSISGHLSLRNDSQLLIKKRARCKPERRILLPLLLDGLSSEVQSLSLQLE